MKRILSLIVVVLMCLCLVGCTQADRVSKNISKEADRSEAEAKYALKNRRSVSLVDGHIEE